MFGQIFIWINEIYSVFTEKLERSNNKHEFTLKYHYTRYKVYLKLDYNFHVICLNVPHCIETEVNSLNRTKLVYSRQ